MTTIIMSSEIDNPSNEIYCHVERSPKGEVDTSKNKTKMNENLQTNTPQQEEEINIMEYVMRLWKVRKKVLLWCGIGAVVGLVIGFSLPKYYEVSVKLAPETEQKIGSGVSSIASMMGVNLDNSVDAIRVDFFPDVVASTPFLFELSQTPVTFERKKEVIETTLMDYLLEYQKAPWWSVIISAPFKGLAWVMSLFKEKADPNAVLNPMNLPTKQRKALDGLSKKIVVTVDKKTGKTDIQVQMQDPLVVATVADAVVENLKTYMTRYRTSKVSQDVKNLTEIYNQRREEYYAAQQAYANYADANSAVVKQSARAELTRLQQEMNLAYQVFSQVATQLEAARIKEQEAKPVFATLEPVSIPDRKAGPSKAKILLIWVFLFGAGAAAWELFGKDYLARLKAQM